MKAIKQFATKHMGTKDVRLDPQLNKKIWENGVKNPDYRLRLRIARKRNDEEGAKEKLYSYVSHVAGESAKGLQTVTVESTDAVQSTTVINAFLSNPNSGYVSSPCCLTLQLMLLQLRGH